MPYCNCSLSDITDWCCCCSARAQLVSSPSIGSLSRNFWGCWRLLWRLWSEPTNRMLRFQHRIEKRHTMRKEWVAPFKPLLNPLCIFLSYAFDNLIQVSFWSIPFRQVGAWTFLSMLHIICSVSMTRWFSPHWHLSSVFLYLISICSLPINERRKGKHPSHSLMIYCYWWGDLICLLNILDTFCWSINSRDVPLPN